MDHWSQRTTSSDDGRPHTPDAGGPPRPDASRWSKWAAYALMVFLLTAGSIGLALAPWALARLTGIVLGSLFMLLILRDRLASD